MFCSKSQAHAAQYEQVQEKHLLGQIDMRATASGKRSKAFNVLTKQRDRDQQAQGNWMNNMTAQQ